MLCEEPEVLAPEEGNRLLPIGKVQNVSAFLDVSDCFLRIVGSCEIFQPADFALQIIVGGLCGCLTLDF